FRSRAVASSTVAGILTVFLGIMYMPPPCAYGAAPKPSKAGTPAASTRVEKDLLGEKQIPAQAYYGVQTARALENFQLSGVPINRYPGYVEAWAIVKLAA